MAVRCLTCLVVVLVAALCAGSARAQADPAAAQESIGGVLKVPDADGKRVPAGGVRVTVSDASANRVAEVESAEDGSWRAAVPGPGRYDVTIDVATLPEGVTLRRDRPASLSLNVLRSQSVVAIFPLTGGEVEAVSQGGNLARRLLQALTDGLVFGVILAIASIGLSLVYGVTRIVNFAHGELVSIGAMVAVYLNAFASGPQITMIVAGILAVVLVACAGPGLDRLFGAMSARATDHFAILIFSIGLSFALRNGLLFVFGPGTFPYRQYALQELVSIGPVVIAPRDIGVMAVSLLILVSIGLLLLYTRLGRAMRAVSTNSPLAEQSGINVRRITQVTWILGAGLAASGGVLLAVNQQARWDLGFNLLMYMFAAVILGGIGTAFGALVGALIIGVLVQLSTVYIPYELKPAVAMAVLILVLLFQPQGLLNRAQRIG